MNLSVLVRVFGLLDSDYADGSTIQSRIDNAKAYVDNRVYRADVVTTLPPDAPGGYLMVKAGDINLYIGTGIGSPLRKIPTQALP